MEMTAIQAVTKLAVSGDENAAWEIAQKDEGMLPGVSKDQWLNWARSTLIYQEYQS